MVLRADETGGGQVFVIQQVFDGVQAGRRDVGARQIGQPVVRGAVADDIGDEGVDLADVRGARAMAAKARIVGQFRLADQGEEVAPVLVVVDQQAQVAVGRGVGPAVRREQPGVAGGAQRRVERGAAQVVAQRHVRHALEHGNLDLLPASAGAGMQHGRHQRDGGMQADGAIRQRQGA